MKRWIAALLSGLLLLGCCGCRQRVKTPEKVLEQLLAAMGEQAHCSRIYTRKELMKTEEGQTFLSSLYGKTELPPHFESVSDCALALSRKDDGFEIQVFYVDHLSEAERVEELLLLRASLLKSVENKRYMMDDYDHYIASTAVCRKGSYIFLLCGGDNDMCLEILEKIL